MKALSTLFYPEPDSMCVFGSDNSSYWLILFVKSDYISTMKPLYYTGIVVEVYFLKIVIIHHFPSLSSLVADLFSTGEVFTLYGSIKFALPLFITINSFHVLHSNMNIIFTNFYFTFQSGSVARLVTIIYETKLVHLSALGDAPLPQLAIVRTFSLAQAFCLLCVAGIERVFATYFVADYERKRRYYLSIIIITIVDVIAVSASYTMVTGILNGYVVCVVVILPNFACAVMLRVMLKWNRKRLAEISHVLKRSANNEYSLSLRLQLKENIWSIQALPSLFTIIQCLEIKKIEFGMYLVIIGLTVNLIITFAPIFVLTEPNEMETLQWCQWAANVLIAITITLCVPMGTFAIAMHTGEMPWYARLYVQIFGSKESIEVKVEKKETDTYFGQLHSQWDLAMRRASVWKRA